MWGGGGGGRGGTIRKIVKTSLHNKNKSRTDHKKKKNARTRPSEAEKGKSRKIERVREIDKKMESEYDTASLCTQGFMTILSLQIIEVFILRP